MKLDDELFELLEQSGYTLIIDEAFDVVKRSSISKDDMNLLRDQGCIDIINNRVCWSQKASNYKGAFYEIKVRAQAETLYYHSETFLIDVFPPKIFTAFYETYVLTYLFEAQIMSYYFKLFKLQYTKFTLKDGELLPYNPALENRGALLKQIDVYEGSHNSFGDLPTAFSSSWLNRQTDETKAEIKKSMYSYVRNVHRAKSSDVLWSTKKSEKIKLSGKGYTKGFIPLNTRATNLYADRDTLMYMFNCYMNPIEKVFINDSDIQVNENLLAVSDLLQWVWRSRIRNGEPIKLYMPSSRMRELLNEWANYKI